MRAWVLMREIGIEFEECQVRMDGFDDNSGFKTRMREISPAGKVPVLVDGTVVAWDTLSIAEYLAEAFPERQLWPAAAADRALARSMCAEIHSGLSALRAACPMNIEAHLPHVGALAVRDNPPLVRDLERLIGMCSPLLANHGGPMLFGRFTIADAYCAPLVMRLLTYDLPVPADIQAYMERVANLKSVTEWVEQARQEQDFLVHEEPYRLTR